MANTNTGGDAFIIGRTALEAAFGIMRVMAKKGLIDAETFGQIYAASFPDAGTADKADFDNLTHHCRAKLDEVKQIAKL